MSVKAMLIFFTTLGLFGNIKAQDSNDKGLAAWWPVLSLGANLSTGYAKPGGRLFGQLDNNFYQQLSIRLAISLFTRGVNKNND